MGGGGGREVEDGVWWGSEDCSVTDINESVY